MKFSLFSSAALVCVLSACASTPSAPTGFKSGQFVDFACDGGKRLSARAAAQGDSIRVRFEGGWELDRKADGVYEAEGWKLVTSGGKADLSHNGKLVAQSCKPA